MIMSIKSKNKSVGYSAMYDICLMLFKPKVSKILDMM